MKKYFLIITVAITILFTFIAGSRNVVHAVTAEEAAGQCTKDIEAIEKQAESTDDAYKKANLYQGASDKGFSCLRQSMDLPDYTPDMPRLGADEYRETTNYLKYCKITIDQKEKDIAPEQDPDRRVSMLEDLMTFSFKCLRAVQGDLFEPSLAPRLGADDLHETTNYVSNCEKIIELKNQNIHNITNPMVRFGAMPDLVSFTTRCLLESQSDLFEPSLAPRLGADDFHETSNLINNCNSIMNDLKNRYDPLFCEPNDVAVRNQVVKDIKTVEKWCKNELSSDLMDPSLVPDLSSDIWGVNEFYTNRVCGILPDDPEGENSGQSLPDKTASVTASTTNYNCNDFKDGYFFNAFSGNPKGVAKCDLENNFTEGSLTHRPYMSVYLPIQVNPESLPYSRDKYDEEIRTFPGAANVEVPQLNMGEEWPSPQNIAPGEFYEFKQLSVGDFGSYSREIRFSIILVGSDFIRVENSTSIRSKFRVGDCFALFSIASGKEDRTFANRLVEPHFFSDDLLKKFKAHAEKIAGVLRNYEICHIGSLNKAKSKDNPPDASVKALINASPKNDDLHSPDDLFKLGQFDFSGETATESAMAADITGQIEMQLFGSDWAQIKKDDPISNNTSLKASSGALATLKFSNKSAAAFNFLDDSVLKFWQVDLKKDFPYREIELESGALRFKTLGGEEKLNLHISTPNSEAVLQGTDFGLAYNKDTNESIWEIYDGKIIVTSEATASSKILSSSYGSAIKQVVVADNGSMNEKIAIPQSEWNAFISNQNKTVNSGAQWYYVIIVLLVVGFGYCAYRWRAQLFSLLQRIVNKDNHP